MEGEIKRVECTWLKDVSGREILASVMAVFGFDACSLCFSGLEPPSLMRGRLFGSR